MSTYYGYELAFQQLFYNGYDPDWIIGARHPYRINYSFPKAKAKRIEVDVQLCCEGCVEKVKRALADLTGVQTVAADMFESKVIVKGDANPDDVLRIIRRVTKKRAERSER